VVERDLAESVQNLGALKASGRRTTVETEPDVDHSDISEGGVAALANGGLFYGSDTIVRATGSDGPCVPSSVFGGVQMVVCIAG
jgi:hypothetical protein